MPKRMLIVAVLVGLFLGLGATAFAQGNDPVIVKRVDGATGKHIFTVQFPSPTNYLGTYWEINGVDTPPQLITGNQPFTYYFPETGTYTVSVTVLFYDKAPAHASITFDVSPLGSPIAKQLEWAKSFVLQYVLPAVAILAVLFGVQLK